MRKLFPTQQNFPLQYSISRAVYYSLNIYAEAFPHITKLLASVFDRSKPNKFLSITYAVCLSPHNKTSRFSTPPVEPYNTANRRGVVERPVL